MHSHAFLDESLKQNTKLHSAKLLMRVLKICLRGGDEDREWRGGERRRETERGGGKAKEKQLTSFPCRGKNIYSGKVQDVPVFIFLTLQVGRGGGEGGGEEWEDEMEGVERGIVEVNEKQFIIFSLSVVKMKRPRKRKQVSKVCKDHFYLRDKFS